MKIVEVITEQAGVDTQEKTRIDFGYIIILYFHEPRSTYLWNKKIILRKI